MNLSGSGPGFKPDPHLPAGPSTGLQPPLRPARPSHRRPALPPPLEFVPLRHPGYPASEPDLTILHLTDLHVRRRRGWTPFLDRLAALLAHTPVDLAVFTGDAMDHPGDEPAALDALRRLLASVRSRLGIFGVFGNHDSVAFRERARSATEITWLQNQVHDIPGACLRLLGPEDPEDLLTTCRASLATGVRSDRFEIGLVHYPTEIYPAAAFKIPILFAGHTHGGQIRLSSDIAPHTSTDLPGRLASGVLRLADTLCCVPRGLGQAVVQWRLNCPPQAPVYILGHGELGTPAPASLTRITSW